MAAHELGRVSILQFKVGDDTNVAIALCTLTMRRLLTGNSDG